MMTASSGFYSTTDFDEDDDILERGEKYEKDREYHDLEKLFERRRKQNDFIQDEEEEFADDGDADDYEFNGDHKTDLNEEVKKKAATQIKQDEQRTPTKATTIQTTKQPTTTSIPMTTFVNKLPFHPRQKIIRHQRYHHSNNPILRAIHKYYNRENSHRRGGSYRYNDEDNDYPGESFVRNNYYSLF